MSALLKVYTDNAHTNELAHSTNASTTLNGALSAGATQATLTSAAGMPTAGVIDIIDGTNGNETIAYFGLSGNVIQFAKPTAVSHANGLTVNQWYYLLAVGDQTNGIPNDGSNAAPNSPTNVGTWYVYNAGDQQATSPTFSTSNSSPSTALGFSDTLISITSAAAGFSASVSPSNIAAGSQQQIWVVAEIPANQNPAGTNPQLCVLNLTYNSI